jgi:16S rRNA (guanine(966)-N(2))-methyltransferase RsmD
MRISGGLAKGRRIATKRLFSQPSKTDEELRPTSSKVREALFDIIRDKIEGASFVDLYAGTGTVGLEALSRGAGKAVFVEPNRLRSKAIKENAFKFGFSEKVTVVERKAHEFLKKASVEKKGFDIFFVDPPYFSEEIIKTLPIIGEKGLLNDKGTVIVEHFFKRKLPEVVGELKMIRNYRYGDTMLTIYTKKKETENIGGFGEEDCRLSRDI